MSGATPGAGTRLKRLVLVRVERLADGIDLADAGGGQRLVEQPQRRALPVEQRRLTGLLRGHQSGLEAVAHGKNRLRKPLGAELTRRIDLAGAALAEIVELGDGPQIPIAVLVRLAA